MINTVSEFVSLVEKMREAQRQYFRSRFPSDLNHSKALERQVDEAIKQYMKRKENKAQPALDLQ